MKKGASPAGALSFRHRPPVRPCRHSRRGRRPVTASICLLRPPPSRPP